MDSSDFLVYPKRSRLWFFLIGTLVLLIASVWVMFNLEQLQYGILRLIALIFGFLGCISFGYALAYNTLRLRQFKAVLHRRQGELEFYASLLFRGTINADNLKSYGLVSYGGRRYLLIFLHHPHKFIDRLKGIPKFRARGYFKRFRTPVAIPAAWVDGNTEEVLEKLSQFKD